MQVDWLNINPLEGGIGQTEIYAYVLPNEKVGNTRNATVRFTNDDGVSTVLNLTQTSDTGDMRFVVTPDYIYVPGGGGTYNVNVLTNTYWKVSDYDSGFTITSDNMEGYGDGILTIVIPPNPNTDNWYGYDHNGRPFYGRDGYITFTSLMGTKRILWEQAAYNAITVTPNNLSFSQTGGTHSITVKSSMDWEITSYDSAHTSFSALSGHSGETTIYVTKSALTQSQIGYYVTCPSTAEFSDGLNVALLFMDSTLDDYYNDDNWLTVTYDVPSANTRTILFAYERDLAISPGVQFQDDKHTELASTSVQLSYDRYLRQYYTTFTTAGEHIVKIRYNQSGTIIPKFGFPAGNIYGVSGSACYKKIVIGNKCSGVIAGCAAKNTGFKEVVLGLGNITLIGEAAFSGCGSYNYDFVLPNNVKDIMYCPFIDFKAKKFVYDMDIWGGDNDSEEKIPQNNSYKYISGGVQYPFSVYVYGRSYGKTGSFASSTSHYEWSKFPGPFDCKELVIGQNVRKMYTNGIYPFGYVFGASGDAASLSRPGGLLYTYSASAAPIKCDSLSMLRKLPPSVPGGLNANITRTRTTFRLGGGDAQYADFGFDPSSKPFHYPIGGSYNGWISTFTDYYEDIDI